MLPTHIGLHCVGYQFENFDTRRLPSLIRSLLLSHAYPSKSEHIHTRILVWCVWPPRQLGNLDLACSNSCPACNSKAFPPVCGKPMLEFSASCQHSWQKGASSPTQVHRHLSLADWPVNSHSPSFSWQTRALCGHRQHGL